MGLTAMSSSDKDYAITSHYAQGGSTSISSSSSAYFPLLSDFFLPTFEDIVLMISDDIPFVPIAESEAFQQILNDIE